MIVSARISPEGAKRWIALGILALLVLFVSGGFYMAQPNDRFSDKTLLKIEHSLGVSLCADNPPPDKNDWLEHFKFENSQEIPGSFTARIDSTGLRESLVKEFDDVNQPCQEINKPRATFFPLSSNEKILRRMGNVQINGIKVPVIVKRSRLFDFNKYLDYGRIFVRVPGGPGNADIYSYLNQALGHYEDAITVDFYYTGNGFNTIHPTPGLGIASEQLAHFLFELRSRNPKANIVVFGESLGAVISLSAMQLAEKGHRLEKNLVDRLILMSPPFGSLKETGQRLENMSARISQDRPRALYRIRQFGPDYHQYGQLKSLDPIEVFYGFFPAEEGEITLHNRASSISELPRTLLIYGTADERINPARSVEFTNEPIDGLTVIKIDNMGHSPLQNDHVIEIRDAVEDFVYY